MGKTGFELRTMYNFRLRISQHRQKTSENPYEQVFEQVAFKLKTDQLRMDCAMIASIMRGMTRLQLPVEALQRVRRGLN
jgi:hypothetical protein